ncbi:serine/threonine transporter SstT [Treponema saccharophilum]|uniref:Sodium:dicarboxylate symporter n=1 Tax=Treponema saccharophilum DSM 2985 TaxID=907348 RepID=H7EKK7_9SPIR|nr:serine/threonine transporter SstT [Treponema saccharophilum]EIC01912.1 sodium:dicarboxylate symporter [Treponema saccharophilum DSM 2985]BDC97485.1 serine/threonine transporter SstT [Treponema saccharophilum]
MNFLKKVFGVPLVLRIAIGLVLGIVLGLLFPQASFIGVLGTLFIGALKGVAPILVLLLVISSLSVAGKNLGKRFTMVIALYIASTLIAALIAVLASYMFPVTVVLASTEEMSAPGSLSDVFSNLLTNMVMNPVACVMNANYVGILFWAILTGLSIRKFTDDSTKTVLKDISTAVSVTISWIIQTAPFGILGIAFTTVSDKGLMVFTSYGKLIVLLVGCMLFQALVINPLIVAVSLKKNPYPLVFRCLRESAVTAFFTRSSAANIPINMALCEKLGLHKDFYSVSIPLGATINMDGAAITITVMSLAAAKSLGIEVHILHALILSIVATLGACGASGVAGGSLLLIPMACSMLGVPQDIAMQMVSIGFMIGIIQDSLETALNSSSDVLITATADFAQKNKNLSAEANA